MLYDDTNNLLNELINCQICLNSFDEIIHKPYSIYKCGHTYCIVCLNHLNKSLNNKCPDCRSYIQNIAPNWQSLRILSFIKNNEQKQQITFIKTKQNIQTKQRIRNYFLLILKYLQPKIKFVLFYAYYICLVALLIYSLSILIFNICFIDYRIPLWTIIYSLTKIVLLNLPFKSDILSGFFIFIFFIIFILIWYFIGTLWMLELFYSTSVKITSNKCCFVTLFIQWILFGVWFLNITFNLIGEFISLILCYFLFALFYIFIQSKKIN